jgi:hypothetical protein
VTELKFRATSLLFVGLLLMHAAVAFSDDSTFESSRKKADESFTQGSKYKTATGKEKFAILKEVTNTPGALTPKTTFSEILENYRNTGKRFRLKYFEGVQSLIERMQRDFVADKPGLAEEDYNALKELLQKSTEGGFRGLPDAELMLASDNLLNALDSRFTAKTNAPKKTPPPASNPAPATDPATPPVGGVGGGSDEEKKPESPSAAEAFKYAAAEAGFGLSTFWMIRQDVELLDYVRQPNAQGLLPVPLESLYLQLQERRLQSRINGAKVQFNESSRGKRSKAEIQAERDAAEDELQKTGVEAYLSLAILGASQKNSTAFTESGAGELRTKLGVAARVHTMIRSGKQPDGYIESFIPNRNPVELYADAITATITAIEKENIAKASRLEQLTALNQISGEIEKQRQSFRYPLEQLSGFRFDKNQVLHGVTPLKIKDPNNPAQQIDLDPSKPEHREAFFQIVDKRIETEIKNHVEEVSRRTRSVTESIHRETDLSGTKRELDTQRTQVPSAELPITSFGALGASAIGVQQATTTVFQSYQSLQHALEAINDEKNYVLELDGINQEVLQKSRQTLTEWAEKQKNLAAEQVFLSSTSVSVSAGVSFIGPVPTPFVSAGISGNPLQLFLAANARALVENAVSRDLATDSLRSEKDTRERAAGLKKTLKRLWREFDAQLINLGHALLTLEQARNNYGLRRANLSSLVEDWASAKNLAGMSFEAYADQCVQRQASRLDADQALRDAVKSCYLASKAFQYVWVERYSNPITVMGTGTDVVLPKGAFQPFTNPESILGARDANELRDYLEALYEWHKALSSGLRGSPRANAARFTKMISLRKQILGLDEYVIRPTDIAPGTSKPLSLDQRRELRVKEFRAWVERQLFESGGEMTAFAFEFATDIDTDGMFSRDEWNQKIQRIGVNFLGDQLPASSPTVSLTQSGIVSVRRFPPIFQNIERYSLSGYGLNEFDELFSRPAEQRTYDKISQVQIQASRKDFLQNAERTMSAALVDMSVAADRWAFLMNFRDPSNRLPTRALFPIRRLDDIEFIFQYSYNHPSDTLSPQIRQHWERLSTVVRH